MKNVGVAYSYAKGKLVDTDTDELLARLQRGFDEHNLKAVKLGLKDQVIEITENMLRITQYPDGADVKNLDALYVVSWPNAPELAMVLSTYAKRNGIKLIKSEILAYPATTKLGELVKMSDQNIPLPNSFIARNKILRKLVTSNSLPIRYPFIAKSIAGARGLNNHLVKDSQEMLRIIDANPNTLYVLQDYIPNDCDYRILVLGGKARLVLKRTRQNQDTHLNNTSQGAIGEIVPVDSIPRQCIEDAVKAAAAIGRSDMSGVDLIIDSVTGKHYILEVNKMPQIESGGRVEDKVVILSEYINEVVND